MRQGQTGTLTTAGVKMATSSPRGIRGGSIVNLDEASEAIAQAVERAENVVLGVNVQSVTVAHCGRPAHLQPGHRPGVDRRATDLRQHRPGPRDQPRALADQAAGPPRGLNILAGSRLGAWTGRAGCATRAPCSGRTLGVELLVVSVSEAVFQTLGACVERAHLQFEGVVAAPFVSALAALEEDEMDLGSVRCIDMGGGSTSAAVKFTAGSLVHVETVPVGGHHVTQGHRPRPFDLHRRRRTHQDPAWLCHRLGQRGPRDDRGPPSWR